MNYLFNQMKCNKINFMNKISETKNKFLVLKTLRKKSLRKLKDKTKRNYFNFPKPVRVDFRHFTFFKQHRKQGTGFKQFTLQCKSVYKCVKTKKCTVNKNIADTWCPPRHTIS